MLGSLVRNVRSLRTLCLALIAAVTLLTLAGCGDDLSGTYTASEGPEKMSLTFKGDNKVHMVHDSNGQKEEVDGTYAIDGNNITVSAGMIPMVLTKNGNNLVGPFGMVFKKQ